MNFNQKIKQDVISQSLVAQGDSVLLGVSGGPDSVALAHIFHSFACELGIRLTLVHFNHRLRKSSDLDQKFVEKLATSLNIPCKCGVSRVQLKKKKGSLEENARKERFAFFFKQADLIKADSIALAHTDDDLAETVLMRIIRGSGLKGLRAILPKANIDGYTMIRPMLNHSKRDVIAYLKKNKLSFRKDETNKDKAFMRNRIRHELLPLLERNYNSNIRQTLSNLSTNSSVDYGFIDHEADKAFRAIAKMNGTSVVLNTQKMRRTPLAVANMVFQKSFEYLNGSTNALELKHIQQLNTLLNQPAACSKMYLPKRTSVERNGRQIRIYKVRKA